MSFMTPRRSVTALRQPCRTVKVRHWENLPACEEHASKAGFGAGKPARLVLGRERYTYKPARLSVGRKSPTALARVGVSVADGHLQPVVPSIGHDELASVYRQPARVIQLAGRHAVPSPAAHQGAAGVSIHLDDAVHAGVGEEEGAAVGSNGQAVPAGGRGGKVDQAGRRLERAWRRHAQGRTGGKGTRRLGC